MIKIDGKIISITQKNYGAIEFDFLSNNSTAYAVDGYTLTFMVKKSKSDPDSSASIVKTAHNLTGSKITVQLFQADTNIPVGTYWWGLQLSMGDYVNQCASGPFYITDGVING